MSSDKEVRIILFSGKGGVGKTTIASATGVRAAALGYKTLILSLDVAHSLADSFDLNVSIHDKHKGQMVQVGKNLWIQEIDVQEEVERYWGNVQKYIAELFNTTGMDEIVAEELAILPGMEEVCALLYINEYIGDGRFDVLILDCAPTGESLRFISMPATLDWYMRKIFRLERRIMKIARPIAKRMTDVPLPKDEYFATIQRLFTRLHGVDSVLLNQKQTTVRLVTNAEKMVLNETFRAYLYFCMYGMSIDSIVVNRLIPQEVEGGFFDRWKETQDRYLALIREKFEPIPIRVVPLLEDEVTGTERIGRLADTLYGNVDPTDVMYEGVPYSFEKIDSGYLVRIRLPFVEKEHVDLHKNEDSLIVRVGGFKRHIPLPRSAQRCEPSHARFEGDDLVINLTR